MPLITVKKEVSEDLLKKRHSLSHLLATAVQKLYPQAKLGIGPAIENGFYYDFDIDTSITDKDLKKIEKEIRGLIYKKIKFEKKIVSIDEAKKIFKDKGEIYKVELIEDLEEQGEKEVSLYYNGEWFDLCKGPHVESTEQINPEGLKLDRVSGAYWKGDEKNKMMQRVYGLYVWPAYFLIFWEFW